MLTSLRRDHKPLQSSLLSPWRQWPEPFLFPFQGLRSTEVWSFWMAKEAPASHLLGKEADLPHSDSQKALNKQATPRMEYQPSVQPKSSQKAPKDGGLWMGGPLLGTSRPSSGTPSVLFVVHFSPDSFLHPFSFSIFSSFLPLPSCPPFSFLPPPTSLPLPPFHRYLWCVTCRYKAWISHIAPR